MPISGELYYHYYEGSRLHSRPTIVLIHGAGGTNLFWPSQLRRLPGFRVYAPDLPGHGNSPGSGQQSISAYCKSILNWLDSIQLPNAVFCGHSMGSAIVQTLALDYPDQVLGLVLIGAGSRLLVNPAIIEGTSSPTTYQSTINKLSELCFSPQTPQDFVKLAAKRMLEIRYTVLNGDLVACNHFDVSDRVSSIQKPTLIITGADDRMTPARQASVLAKVIPRAQLEVIPEAGHLVMLEKPQIVAEVMLSFLNRMI
jgi:pimeloyl-ACP methyl ester carboxylesterase